MVDASRAYVAEHALVVIPVGLLFVMAALKNLSATNVERERSIRGGHYKGKITPKWMKIFAREQSIRDAQAQKAREEREKSGS